MSAHEGASGNGRRPRLGPRIQGRRGRLRHHRRLVPRRVHLQPHPGDTPVGLRDSPCGDRRGLPRSADQEPRRLHDILLDVLAHRPAPHTRRRGPLPHAERREQGRHAHRRGHHPPLRHRGPGSHRVQLTHTHLPDPEHRRPPPTPPPAPPTPQRPTTHSPRYP